MKSKSWANIDGNISELESASIPITDAGFLYGYGVFETILIKKNEALWLPYHLERIKNSAKALKIECPWTNDELVTKIRDIVHHASHESSILNLYITAGDRQEGFTFGPPRLMITLRETPQYSPALTIRFKTDSHRGHLDQYKSLSYLKSITAKTDISPEEEVIFLTKKQEILEGATSSVFVKIDNDWVTPNNPNILPSITRDVIQTHQKDLGITVVKRKLFQRDLKQATEIFLARATQGITTVKKVEDFPNLKSKHSTKILANKYQKLSQKK